MYLQTSENTKSQQLNNITWLDAALFEMDLDAHFNEAKARFEQLKPGVDFLKRPKEVLD